MKRFNGLFNVCIHRILNLLNSTTNFKCHSKIVSSYYYLIVKIDIILFQRQHLLAYHGLNE